MTLLHWIAVALAGALLLGALIWWMRSRGGLTTALKGVLPMKTDYKVSATSPYGPVWGSRRPPGLPASVRQCSAPGGAASAVEAFAKSLHGQEFASVLVHLGRTESGLIWARPADRFNNNPPSERPEGVALITAWGVFQFNRDAWRSLAGVGGDAFPWEASPEDEIRKPIIKYAGLWKEARDAGADALYAGRAIRLWHRNPFGTAGRPGHDDFVRKAKESGWDAAWLMVAQEDRGPVDRHLKAAGLMVA